MICGFPSSLCAEQSFKAELEHQVLQFFMHITVAECFWVEAINRRLQVLNHSSLGLRISHYIYWVTNTTVT